MRKKTYAARVLAAVLAGTMILPGCSGQTETAAETDTAAEESRTEASSEAQRRHRQKRLQKMQWKNRKKSPLW